MWLLLLLFLTATLWGKQNHCFHFRNEETVAQRVCMTTRVMAQDNWGKGTHQSSSRTFLVLQDNLPDHFAVQQHYASGPGTRQALPLYLHSFQHRTSTPQVDQAPYCPANTRWMSTSSLCLHCSPWRECSSFLSSFSSPSIKANCNSTTSQTVLSFSLFTSFELLFSWRFTHLISN